MKWSDYPIHEVKITDKNYPKGLHVLKDPPQKLYYRGDINVFENSLAIVGSRRMTRYGEWVVEKFVAELVSIEVTTISGFMYGVDTAVHSKTLEFGGKTVAVMGGGINTIYPLENDKLYTKIVQTGGAVLSEYTPEAKPKLWMYPSRNRIVAALSAHGVLVVEAAIKSGSLITAAIATKLQKPVYAIPGPLNSTSSAGTLELIKEGKAKMVTSASDILDTKVSKSNEDKHLVLEGVEKKIYDSLNREDMSADELVLSLGIDMKAVSTALSMMSLKGYIKESGGRYTLS